MKKVMIAIDYNPCAQKVAETGYAYAKALNAEVSIVQALSDISYYSIEYLPVMGFKGFSLDGPYSDIDEQRKEAYNFLSCIVRHLGDKKIRTKVLNGRMADSILEYADEWQADLIVIGTQSHRNYEELYSHDATSTILRQSNIAVLVVPADKKQLKLSKEKEYAFLQF